MFHVAEDLGNEMRQRRHLRGDAPIRRDVSNGADVVVRQRERGREVRDDVCVVDVAERAGPETRIESCGALQGYLRFKNFTKYRTA